MEYGPRFHRFFCTMLQAGGKDCKAELRDHDHVVECVAWAPEAATQVLVWYWSTW